MPPFLALVIELKLLPVKLRLPGCPNGVVFVVLKASARNCSPIVSVKAKFFNSDASRFL